ncbi:MAG: replication initiator protein [Microviridae sp.]|nr:MAG: replication initiator protein [Microviridae sp.]
MPCYRPLTAYYNTQVGEVVWSENHTHGNARQISLPCGQCIGCKLQRANDWATRCSHEASLHTCNMFGTFTYAEEKLATRSLCHRDWQLFAKKLRNALSRKWSANSIEISDSLYYTADMGLRPIPQLKYYMAGQYGSRTRRPHFHACLFGIDMSDKKYWYRNENGDAVYTSTTLDELWGNGFTSIGSVTYESAAYIARYIVDKKTGPNAGQYYQHIDEDGVITDLEPEYNRMSLSEGIGKRWLKKFQTDVYPHGNVITRGKANKAPKFYDKIYKNKEPDKFDAMKAEREFQAAKQAHDNTLQRLQQKERVKLAQLNQLTRSL